MAIIATLKATENGYLCHSCRTESIAYLISEKILAIQ
jgi:hypothetical protein